MQLHIPNSAFLGNIDPFLHSFNPEDPNKLVITANKKWISVHPVVLAMVASLGIRLNPNQIHFEALEAKSKHYLARMGLFKILNVSSSIKVTSHEASGRFIPLMKIQNSNDLTHFIQEIIPLLHLNPSQSEDVRYIVSELIRNVLEHAQASAIVCAQYYAKSNVIRIGVVDTGVGIKKAISISHTPKDELHAIQLALTPGITGTTPKEGGTEYNAGAGLFFVKSLARANRDFFLVYSGSAMFKLLKRPESSRPFLFHANPFEDQHSKSDTYPFWKGTVIGVDVTLDQTTDFSEFLDHVRDVFRKSIRARKKERHRTPRFS